MHRRSHLESSGSNQKAGYLGKRGDEAHPIQVCLFHSIKCITQGHRHRKQNSISFEFLARIHASLLSSEVVIALCKPIVSINLLDSTKLGIILWSSSGE